MARIRTGCVAGGMEGQLQWEVPWEGDLHFDLEIKSGLGSQWIKLSDGRSGNRGRAQVAENSEQGQAKQCEVK